MASRSRRSGWIIASALAVCVLATSAVVLWIWLPRWAPDWVVRNSPWFGPAFRTIDHTSGAYDAHLNILADRLRLRAIPGGMAALAAMHHHPDQTARGIAIEVIERVVAWDPEPAALAMLVRSMRHDPEARLRTWAVLALPEKRIAESCDVLVELLADPAFAVRVAACGKLGKPHRPAATRGLITALRDFHPAVIIAACESLASPFTAEAGSVVAPLRSLLVHPDPAIAIAAWKALWSLPRAAREVAELEQMPVKTVVGWNLTDQLEQDRLVIALAHVDRQALAWGEEKIPELVEIMRGDDRDLCLRAARALVVVLAGEPLPEDSDGNESSWVLRKPEQHAERERRIAAALRRGVDVQAALLSFGQLPGSPEEPEKGADSDLARAEIASRKRWYRLIGLRGSDTAEAREIAARAVVEEQDDLALQAALNLAVLHDGRAFAPLVRLLAEGGMTRRACAGLGALGEQRAIEPLVTSLIERSETSAAIALGEVGDHRAITGRSLR